MKPGSGLEREIHGSTRLEESHGILYLWDRIGRPILVRVNDSVRDFIWWGTYGNG
jgi:hypothetical protein